MTRNNRLNKWSDRLRDPEWRRYGYLLLGGKALGLGLVLTAIYYVSSLIGAHVTAADAPPPPVLKGNDIVNPLNTVWTLLAAFLVFGMQAGFTMLEAGFCRSRETVNVLMECVVDTCLCGLLFYAWGFAFMFGSGTPFFGTEFFFLQGTPATYGSTGVAFLAFWLFQYAFADTCSTITSGAMIGRTGFFGDLLYSIGVSGFIYPIFGHWAWGPDGFLATMGSKGMFLEGLGIGFHDFAGSTVVHTIGGWVALAGAIVLGPRIGRKFKSEGGGPMLPHDLTVATVGGIILWFGWYGFNPGSTLSAMDFEGIGRVAAYASVDGGRRRAMWVAGRAHAVAGAGLVLIAAIPQGQLPGHSLDWLAFPAGGLVAGGLCGVLIGVVCGGTAPVELADVWSLARRPSEALRSWLDPRELVRLGAAVRHRTTNLFEGMFDPAPPPPASDLPPPSSPEPPPAARSE